MIRKLAVVLCLVVAWSVSEAAPFFPNNKKIDVVRSLVGNDNNRHNNNKVQDVHAELRGGAAAGKKKKAPEPAAPWLNPQKFLVISAIVALFNGASTLALPWESLQGLAPYLEGVADPDPKVKILIGASVLGWGVGKISASKSGPDGAKDFCRLNLIPIAVVNWMLLQTNDYFNIVVNGLLFVGYVYYGLLEK